MSSSEEVVTISESNYREYIGRQVKVITSHQPEASEKQKAEIEAELQKQSASKQAANEQVIAVVAVNATDEKKAEGESFFLE